jgi:DNA-binding winged helix-turn-helix (wHTH) protein/CO dehydrogenase nickel-insertion accessory protein CooC1
MINTFYSYKGGAGRSMALANIAEYLVDLGVSVVMIDCDLEAPGLERFFFTNGGIENAQNHLGFVDLVHDYKDRMRQEHDLPAGDEFRPIDDLGTYLIEIDRPTSGSLKLMTSGRRSSTHPSLYADKVRAFDWEDFYKNWAGAAFFEWLRDELSKAHAQVVLIDSRTGVTDMGYILTYQVADVVVMFCAPYSQSIDGTLQIAKQLRSSEVANKRGRPLEILVVPSRVEDRVEKELSDEFQQDFLDTFALDELVPRSWNLSAREGASVFWKLKIPYVPYYAFSEEVAMRDRKSDISGDINTSFSTIAGAMLSLCPEDLTGDTPALQKLVEYFDSIKRPLRKSIPPILTAPTVKPTVSLRSGREKFKIYVASPGDVWAEREAAIEVLRTLQQSFDLEIYHWEDTIPQLGNPTLAINNQILAHECHIVVAIFWSRLGTQIGLKRPDGTPYLSGTQYEIEQAIEANNRNGTGLPMVMLYQKKDDPYPVIKDNPDAIIQYGRLLEYLREFDPSGSHPALIMPFKGNEFQDLFRKHIDSVLLRLNQEDKKTIQTNPSEHMLGELWARKVGLTSISLKREPAGIEGKLSNEDLHSVIAFWLTSISEDKRAPYRSVGQLCDSAELLANRIDDEIVELAQSSPQNARWLIENLFQIHCEDEVPPRLIQPTSWQRVRFEWEGHIRRSAAPVERPMFRIEGQRIYYGEHSLVLTRRGKDLLRRLIEMQGDVCTYAELIAVGWPHDDPSGVSKKALIESIRRLRSELRKKYPIDADRWIEAIYNEGYRLRLPDEVPDHIDAAKRGV